MKQGLRASGLIGLSALLLSGISACRTVQKFTGTEEAYLNGNAEQVVEAAREAMEELDMTVISSSASRVEGHVKGATSDGSGVSIKVKVEGDGICRMAVKVGKLGDEGISHSIIAETRERLQYLGSRDRSDPDRTVAR